MFDLIKPYNNDPFVGHLATPITNSTFTNSFLENLPAYRVGLSPLLRGLEIGLAHGYFLIGPFYKLGPLRNSDIALLSGFLSSIGLILIMTVCLTIYGIVSFEAIDTSDQFRSMKNWRMFTSGWLLGSIAGSTFAYIIIASTLVLQNSFLK